MKIQFPTLQVVATAVAAYRYNSNRIVRETVQGPDFLTVSNRQLINDVLRLESTLLTITKEDTIQASAIIDYLSQISIMQTLVNRSDRFLQQVNQILAQPTINTREFGIVAWAPKLAADYRRKDEVREATARYEYTSRYVGVIGERVSTEFTLLESRYIKNMDSHAVLGHDHDGNLIFYWARNEKKICTRGAILGRVKSHGLDKYRGNAMVTTLHYVKII